MRGSIIASVVSRASPDLPPFPRIRIIDQTGLALPRIDAPADSRKIASDRDIMPVLELITSSGLGSLLGMRHALEPDHLAAVSTLVTRERSGYKAALIGACWGLGHTLSLLAVGAVLLVLRAEMTTRVSDAFEFCVALMLIGLGWARRPSSGAPGPAGPPHVHQHGHVVHRHAGVPAHVHVGHWTLARRPLLVGAVHGLAGSGALTALVLTTLPTTAARITYISLFGLGSTLGMAALSGLLGWPLARLGSNHAVGRGISLAVGCGSIGLGLVWGYPLVMRCFKQRGTGSPSHPGPQPQPVPPAPGSLSMVRPSTVSAASRKACSRHRRSRRR